MIRLNTNVLTGITLILCSLSASVHPADGGEVSDLIAGDRVIVQASQHVSQFVRMRARNYFFRSLLDRFEPRVRRGVARIEDPQDE